nr:hypothetical protein [Gemmatimonadaceae bacterium]
VTPLVGDLSERELGTLLRDLETLEAVTPTDVEAPALTPLGPERGAS